MPIRERLLVRQIEQVAFDGVAHQVDLGRHVHLGQNVRFVGADSLDAQ